MNAVEREVTNTPRCPYCGRDAKLVMGHDVYPHRPDLGSKSFWKCGYCQAWVGCHPRTTVPLGRLANAQLRQAKQRAHALFDPRWLRQRDKGAARVKAYAWLAEKLNIAPENCHIGEFDFETCQRAIEVLEDPCVE